MELISQENSYDVIVIGAGVVGVATGLALVKKGVKTLILEQFRLGHTRGSSNGASRLVRSTSQNEIYVSMTLGAYKLWKEIEFEFGEKLIEECGGLVVAMNKKMEKSVIEQTEAQLLETGIKHEKLTGKDINKRWPIFNVSDDKVALFQQTIGFIFARNAIDAMLNQFVKRNGKVLEHTKVVAIQPIKFTSGQESITIKTHKGDTYFCKKIVVCAGPWMNHVLSLVDLQLPISPQKVQVPFWKVIEPEKNAISLGKIPVFLFWCEEEVRLYYGMPEYDYPGTLKIAAHNSIKCDPDHPGRTKQDPNLIPKISRFISQHFQPGFVAHDKPSVTEECIYTLTPDYNAIIDQHPVHSNIYFCGGFSGQGFKLAPVIGQIMTDMVLGNQSKYDRDFFSMKRFSKSKL